MARGKVPKLWNSFVVHHIQSTRTYHTHIQHTFVNTHSTHIQHAHSTHTFNAHTQHTHSTYTHHTRSHSQTLRKHSQTLRKHSQTLTLTQTFTHKHSPISTHINARTLARTHHTNTTTCHIDVVIWFIFSPPHGVHL